ncbi:MAG: alpha/beta hydrolase-fold protein, partial [Myxococcota bacterium]
MIEIIEHESQVLKNNRLRDPSRRSIWVSLPDNALESGRRYPTLYCLAGFAGTGPGQILGTPWSPGVPDRLKQLGLHRDVIVVYVDGFTRLGGSQYLNSSATGAYEDYLCDEIVPLIDSRFPTQAERAHRGVFGKSSGGYGAIRLAVNRPDLFGALASHSGDIGFHLCYLPDFAQAFATLSATGGLEKFLTRFEAREKKRGSDFATMNVIAMAASYSPDSGEPLGIALPFSMETGELRSEVWARWLEHDPLHFAVTPGALDSLRALRLLFVDAGTRDEHHLHLGARLWVAALKE